MSISERYWNIVLHTEKSLDVQQIFLIVVQSSVPTWEEEIKILISLL